MQSEGGVLWARKVVMTKIGLTILIAALGSLLVYIGYIIGDVGIKVTGLLITSLSPILSYIITIRIYGE